MEEFYEGLKTARTKDEREKLRKIRQMSTLVEGCAKGNMTKIFEDGCDV